MVIHFQLNVLLGWTVPLTKIHIHWSECIQHHCNANSIIFPNWLSLALKITLPLQTCCQSKFQIASVWHPNDRWPYGSPCAHISRGKGFGIYALHSSSKSPMSHFVQQTLAGLCKPRARGRLAPYCTSTQRVNGTQGKVLLCWSITDITIKPQCKYCTCAASDSMSSSALIFAFLISSHLLFKEPQEEPIVPLGPAIQFCPL